MRISSIGAYRVDKLGRLVTGRNIIALLLWPEEGLDSPASFGINEPDSDGVGRCIAPEMLVAMPIAAPALTAVGILANAFSCE